MRNVYRTITTAVVVISCTALLPCGMSFADERADLESMRREIQELRRRDTEKQREIDALKHQVQQLHDVNSAPRDAKSGPVRDAKTAPARDAKDAPQLDAQGAPPRDAGARSSSAAALDRAVQDAGKPTAASASDAGALDKAVGALGTTATATTANAGGSSPGLFSRKVGNAEIRLVDVSFDTLLAVGSSTASDGEIERLQGGGHDPQRRGFTLEQAELSFAGAVDPYFTAEAHVVYTPHDVELEEAYFTTTSLPANLQLKGGYFLTEFGRINPTHPHAWDWIDQPIVNTRMFGGDGLRSPGARLAWLSPLPWYSELQVGVQNANEGDLTPSFIGEESIGGRPVVKTHVGSMKDLLYLTRWNNSFNWNDSLTTQIGASGLFGPNGTGADGRTYLYGADMIWKWQPPNHFRGWPFLTWQTEVMRRDYTADHFVDGTQVDGDDLGSDLSGHHLNDWGLYTQLLWGFHHGWAAGVRYEYATGSGPSEDGGRQQDFLRDDRQRVAPLIIWQPSEFSRLRLQYDFDHADFLPEHDAHSVWLSVEVLYGAHPAHQY